MAPSRFGNKKVPKGTRSGAKKSSLVRLDSSIATPGRMMRDASGSLGYLSSFVSNEERYDSSLCGALLSGHCLGVGVESDSVSSNAASIPASPSIPRLSLEAARSTSGGTCATQSALRCPLFRRRGGRDDEEVAVPNTGPFLVAGGWRTPNSPVFDKGFCDAKCAQHGSDDREGARVSVTPPSCTGRRLAARLTCDPELSILEIHVLPLESKQFALSQSRHHVQQDHHFSSLKLQRLQ
jgi:hypothetical protein